MATRSKECRGNEGQLLLPNFSSPPVVIRAGPKPGPVQRRRIRRKHPPPALEPQLGLPGLADVLPVSTEHTEPAGPEPNKPARAAAEEVLESLTLKAGTAARDNDLQGGMALSQVREK